LISKALAIHDLKTSGKPLLKTLPTAEKSAPQSLSCMQARWSLIYGADTQTRLGIGYTMNFMSRDVAGDKRGIALIKAAHVSL
jgi:hypothetical protein